MFGRVVKHISFSLLIGLLALIAQKAHADCSTVTEIPVSECQSLMDLYNNTNGINWKNKSGWNQTNTPCSWFGVTCDAGHVGAINLSDDGNTSDSTYGNNLKGTLPDLNLPYLQIIRLSSNQLSGSIPDFHNLPNLITLYLWGNQLSGSLPNFSNLPKLQYIDFSQNQLSGSIPDFGNFPNLQFMNFHTNQLSGNIPNFRLPNLKVLSLWKNQLSGNIPNFNGLPIEEIDLSENQLSGNIPNFGLSNLKGLSLWSNQLEGVIPNFSLFSLTNLSTVDFSYNCGLKPFDLAQKTILAQKNPKWDTKNPVCPATYILNVSKVGNGKISAIGIDCGIDCIESYNVGTQVNLNATPDAGYIFNNWTGDCAGNSNSCQITMNGNKTVNASFSLIPSYPLTLQTSGDGLGSISGNGNYKVGETVNLTASPDANSVFVDWKPAPCNSSFEMPNNALTCIATFNKQGSASSPSSNADLSFFQINPFYNVGEWVHARLKTQLNVASRFNRVDLWVAVQLPDKTLFFMTGSTFRPFSLEPSAFKRSLESMDAEIVVLDFEVPPNMGGDYVFYALYVETGKNPITDSFTIQRSNLAIATTTLRNR